MNARLPEMLVAADTGQSVERIVHDSNPDYCMRPARSDALPRRAGSPPSARRRGV